MINLKVVGGNAKFENADFDGWGSGQASAGYCARICGPTMLIFLSESFLLNCFLRIS